MKKELESQVKGNQRRLNRCKGQLDRALMMDLRKSWRALSALLLDKAGAHVVICILNALENGEDVNADEVARFAEIARKGLPLELHRLWGHSWKDKTRQALESDFYLPDAVPLKDWGLI